MDLHSAVTSPLRVGCVLSVFTKFSEVPVKRERERRRAAVGGVCAWRLVLSLRPCHRLGVVVNLSVRHATQLHAASQWRWLCQCWADSALIWVVAGACDVAEASVAAPVRGARIDTTTSPSISSAAASSGGRATECGERRHPCAGGPAGSPLLPHRSSHWAK